MARALTLPGTLAAVPTLDQLAARPELANDLPVEVIQALLVRHATVGSFLLGRLLAIPLVADKPRPEHVARCESPYLSAQDAADYLCIKKSRLDHLRREGCVQAARSGKEYTYRREHLDQLREKIELATRTIPRKFFALRPSEKHTKSRR
jgi:hypothetical protein